MSNSFGKGAIESKYDIRDYWYTPADRGAFDWGEGYDVEKDLNIKLQVKNQGNSSSCGGQAWAYYGEVLEKVATKNYEPRSARWIYSHTRVPAGGSSGRNNCAHVIKKGWANESDVTSYENGKPPSEKLFIGIPTLTQEAKENIEVSKALSYLGVTANIEVVAQAIAENYGCVLVVNGADNGTWRSIYPKPPKVKEWGHFVFATGVVIRNGKKYIKIINSWGDKVGEDGYQYLGEDYFKSGHVREGWTLQWDYKPAQYKVLLKKTIKALQQLLVLLKVK